MSNGRTQKKGRRLPPKTRPIRNLRPGPWVKNKDLRRALGALLDFLMVQEICLPPAEQERCCAALAGDESWKFEAGDLTVSVAEKVSFGRPLFLVYYPSSEHHLSEALTDRLNRKVASMVKVQI